uniref:Transcriptional regulator, ArsR family n=1 Tax=Geobacter sp. (strain M21) TaxID=443144 RepID=C6E9I5_GEOSM
MDTNISFEWAELLKAMAHPTRLQIVAELLKGTRCVNDIQEILPASQANISQHLTVLRNAGVVSFTQDGSQRCYFVSRPKLVSVILSQLAEGEPVTRKTKEEIDKEKMAGGACCVR